MSEIRVLRQIQIYKVQQNRKAITMRKEGRLGIVFLNNGSAAGPV